MKHILRAKWLTLVLYFLFIGSLLANLGIIPAESGAFNRKFAALRIIFIMFALGFEELTVLSQSD